MATILIVDDESINRKPLVTLLGYARHRMLEAADGAQALDIASAERPDLIITDILMPTMDGFEFIRRIRADPALAKTRVIFYTATFLQTEARALAEACGVSHVIVKPSDPQEILTTVAAALEDIAAHPTPTPTEEFDREHLRLMTNKLSEKVEELERANLRLTQEVAQRRRAELALRESQKKIERLSRIHSVLSSINSAIVRIRNRQQLFQEAVRIAVEHGKFPMAWIGLLDRTTSSIRRAAWARADKSSADKIIVSELDYPWSGLGYTAVQTKEAAICNNLAADPTTNPWKEEALNQGYLSVMALALSVAGKEIGFLELYASEPDFFNEEELDLLKELAADVSFALDYIENEEKINYLAYYDHLTKLPNRSLICDRLNQLLHAATKQKTRLALVVTDLERFSVINDTFGRRAGDDLLKQIAHRLETIQDTDRISHVSAGWFAIDLPDIREEADVAHFIEEKLIPGLSEPFTVEGEQLRLSFKAGVALSPSDGTDAESLFRNAETALKKAKASADRYLFYTPQMNARVAEKLTIEHRLRGALENDEFVLYYQPKVDLVARRINGLEALLRWNDPAKGLVPPGSFIPILEETGMILDVGRWALERAASDYRQWTAKGLHPPRVSVNVSPLQLRQKDFVVNVAGAIEKCRNGAPALDLEITESLIMDNIEQNIVKLNTLKEMGVDVAIDDFGTGYSSLSYIARLPVNALKIDRSFILDLEKNPNSMSIVAAIISLAHALNLKVIAEGVESEQQSQLLRLLRCDEFQGFVFSPAVPPERVEGLLGG